ncbi:MAG: malonate decarboxylase holo-[acyl-carrier-protein] synthase [Pseudomonadota bacterium]
MYWRHDLVWLAPDGWSNCAAMALPGHRAAIERWQRHDWPAIVRRDDANLADGMLCLGLALPAKGRIALQAANGQVARREAPLALRKSIASAPPAWQSRLAALEAESTGLTLRVYGSLALQALTGQPYTNEHSDIDLLLYPATPAQLQAGVKLLTRHASVLPLDGEIVFPNGACVAWKEWAGADQLGARVLVKDRRTVCLAAREALLASLG